MLHKLRRRIADERGFTLIELLVVILIIGILAAIAIPAFLNQRNKADDASAKAYARNAQTAQESYFTSNDRYTNRIEDLVAIEPTLTDYPDGSAPTITVGARTFEIAVRAKSGVTYTVRRADNGRVTRSCTVPAGTNRGGCPESGTW
jgi:type IV pilus assembly protein PilA